MIINITLILHLKPKLFIEIFASTLTYPLQQNSPLFQQLFYHQSFKIQRTNLKHVLLISKNLICSVIGSERFVHCFVHVIAYSHIYINIYVFNNNNGRDRTISHARISSLGLKRDGNRRIW